jgi:hypothetical protein
MKDIPEGDKELERCQDLLDKFTAVVRAHEAEPYMKYATEMEEVEKEAQREADELLIGSRNILPFMVQDCDLRPWNSDQLRKVLLFSIQNMKTSRQCRQELDKMPQLQLFSDLYRFLGRQLKVACGSAK